MFLKYGEETFEVEVLEYIEFESNEITKPILRKRETYYQSIYKNNINFDKHTGSWTEHASEEVRKANREQLNSIRPQAIKSCQKEIIVYDISTNTHIVFQSISEAKQLVESKHIYMNIHKKQYLPYKQRYVCFLPDEFDVNKIIYSSSDGARITDDVCLYNLLTQEKFIFNSKLTACKYLGFQEYEKKYNMLENYINSDFFTRKNITTLEELFDTPICLSFKKYERKFVKFGLFYNILLQDKISNIKIAQLTGMGRKIIGLIFNHTSKETFLHNFNIIIASLQNSFKIGTPDWQSITN